MVHVEPTDAKVCVGGNAIAKGWKGTGLHLYDSDSPYWEAVISKLFSVRRSLTMGKWNLLPQKQPVMAAALAKVLLKEENKPPYQEESLQTIHGMGGEKIYLQHLLVLADTSQP